MAQRCSEQHTDHLHAGQDSQLPSVMDKVTLFHATCNRTKIIDSALSEAVLSYRKGNNYSTLSGTALRYFKIGNDKGILYKK